MKRKRDAASIGTTTTASALDSDDDLDSFGD